MTIAIGLAFLVMLIGGFMYYWCTNLKHVQVGLVAFAIGLFYVVGGANAITAMIG